MYKLIIADDEPWVTYRLRNLLDYPALGFEVADTAADGKSALEKCRQHQADALLTDIRMPGLDGIELLHMMREQGIQTEVVLISGYAEFSYAQAAVRDGAFDYLVKQVSEQQLLEVMNRLRLRLDQMYHTRLTTQESEALLELAGNESLSVAQWLDKYHYPRPDGLVCFGCFSFQPENALVTLRYGKDMYCALFACPEGHFPDVPCSTAAGLSTVADTGVSVAMLYRQSNIAYLTASFFGEDRCFSYQLGAMEEASRLLSQLEESLRTHDRSQSITNLLLLQHQASGMNVSQITQIHNHLCHLMNRYIDRNVFIEEIMDYQQMNQMYSTLSGMFAFFLDAFNTAPQTETNQFDQVIQYIDSAFAKDLHISDLADMFHFSPSYFSTLFHRYAGMTFSKYLLQKRMEKAKVLINNMQLSIQEIAEQCGYPDYFQFNKAFKRYFNIAPGQYRKQMSSSSS